MNFWLNLHPKGGTKRPKHSHSLTKFNNVYLFSNYSAPSRYLYVGVPLRGRNLTNLTKSNKSDNQTKKILNRFVRFLAAGDCFSDSLNIFAMGC